MIKYSICLPGIALLLFVASCKSPINPINLYGTWKYIKVEKPNASPQDTLTSAELASQRPTILFKANDELSIDWGGKNLSHGKFDIDGNTIVYSENLPNGTIRTFPFWVSKLTDKEIVFETRGQDGSKVTAVRDGDH